MQHYYRAQEERKAVGAVIKKQTPLSIDFYYFDYIMLWISSRGT